VTITARVRAVSPDHAHEIVQISTGALKDDITAIEVSPKPTRRRSGVRR
jgi:hypothetical protein